MFNKKNILKHASNNNDLSIILSKSVIPDWYKKGSKTLNNEIIKKIPIDPGFKLCAPFLDAFTSGYMIPLPQDIAIMQTEGGPSITYESDFGVPISIRSDSSNLTLPIPSGMSKLHFSWLTSLTVKIPKGYSALITHPLNRFDLPFITLSGIVDGEYAVPSGNIPVFISSTFEGLIPAGTPIAQIILFKTENWVMENDKKIIEEAISNNRQSISVASGWYKKNIWKKKQYN